MALAGAESRPPAAPTLPATAEAFCRAIVVPKLVADAGDKAARRYANFFGSIENDNTGAAYSPLAAELSTQLEAINATLGVRANKIRAPLSDHERMAMQRRVRDDRNDRSIHDAKSVDTPHAKLAVHDRTIISAHCTGPTVMGDRSPIPSDLRFEPVVVTDRFAG